VRAGTPRRSSDRALGKNTGVAERRHAQVHRSFAAHFVFREMRVVWMYGLKPVPFTAQGLKAIFLRWDDSGA
jgi:hypothetical protein